MFSSWNLVLSNITKLTIMASTAASCHRDSVYFAQCMHIVTLTHCITITTQDPQPRRSCTIRCMIDRKPEAINYEQQCQFCQYAAGDSSIDLSKLTCIGRGFVGNETGVVRALLMASSLSFHERTRELDIKMLGEKITAGAAR